MAVIAACSLALLAAQAPNSPPAAPTQKITPLPVASVPTNFVLERVVVRDAHGNAVTNLGQSDFQIFDNGAPQTIAYFSAAVAPVQAPSAEVQTAALSIDQALAPLAESPPLNAGPRYTALFFDDYHLQISDLDQTRQAAQQYSTKALGANDQIGIFTASGETNLGFAGDAEKLRAALSQLRSQISPNAPNSVGAAAAPNGDVSVQYTLASLQNLVLRMAGIPGERRIVLVSEGFENPAHQDRMDQIIDAAIRANVVIDAIAAYAVDANGPSHFPAEAPAGGAASIQPAPGTGVTSVDANLQVIEALAEATSGVFIHDSIRYDSGFNRIADPTDASYVLGFVPSDLRTDGSFHKITIMLTAHPDWSAQARIGYLAPPPIESEPHMEGSDLQEQASVNAILGTSDPDQQIRLAQDFLRINPSSQFFESVEDRLVNAYYAKKDWKNFYVAAAHALGNDPDDVDVLVLDGWVSAHLANPKDAGATNQLDRAESFLKHATDLMPALAKPQGLAKEQFAAYKASEMSRAQSGLGLVDFYRQDYARSVWELQEATNGIASPDSTDLWALGVSLQQTRRYTEAADAFEKCSQIPGDYRDRCKKLAIQAGGQRPSARESIWLPPDADAPLAMSSGAQTCSLPDVLVHAGERAQELVDNLQKFTALEKIESQSVDSAGIGGTKKTASYDYIVSFEQGPGAFSVNETRQISKGGKELIGEQQESGLTALALIFHPYYQGDYDMRCEGVADWSGTPAWVIHFVQRNDKPPRTEGIITSTEDIPLRLKGRAWIAKDSYEVMHIDTILLEPVLSINLTSRAVSISYGPVDFRAQNMMLWLPLSAVSLSEFGTTRSVATHSFTDFHLFAVQSVLKPPPQP